MRKETVCSLGIATAMVVVAALFPSGRAAAEDAKFIFRPKPGIISSQKYQDTPPKPQDSPPDCTWTRRETPIAPWASIAFGNGKFVSVAMNKAMVSSDGIAWSSSIVPSGDWKGVSFTNGTFTAVGSSYGPNTLMTSTDGISWSAQQNIPQGSWNAIAYGNGTYVAVGIPPSWNQPPMISSLDGNTWTYSGEPGWPSLRGIAFGDGIFVAVGQMLVASADGINWTLVGVPKTPTGTLDDVIYADGKFVAVTKDNVVTSEDGVNWTSVSVPGGEWHTVAYENGKYVALSKDSQGSIMSSVDAINWKLETPPERANLWSSIAYGKGLFVAVTLSVVATSPCM